MFSMDVQITTGRSIILIITKYWFSCNKKAFFSQSLHEVALHLHFVYYSLVVGEKSFC